MSNFNYAIAQQHELDWQHKYILETYDEELQRHLTRKATLPSNWCMSTFFVNEDGIFNDWIKTRTAVEIGCGSSPTLKECWDIQNRIVIDPLAENYKNIQEKAFGGSFFHGLKIYPQSAEIIIPELLGKVDGFILCRNALDHSEDPFMILDIVSQYAVTGCYFILWTDIWHNYDPDAGHTNITRSKNALKAMVQGMGFEYISDMPRVRYDDLHIEFGGIFRKL